ncbi:hypothetical protein WA158_008429 [Blastocystis sp. Blastoise]
MNIIFSPIKYLNDTLSKIQNEYDKLFSKDTPDSIVKLPKLFNDVRKIIEKQNQSSSRTTFNEIARILLEKKFVDNGLRFFSLFQEEARESFLKTVQLFFLMDRDNIIDHALSEETIQLYVQMLNNHLYKYIHEKCYKSLYELLQIFNRSDDFLKICILDYQQITHIDEYLSIYPQESLPLIISRLKSIYRLLFFENSKRTLTILFSISNAEEILKAYFYPLNTSYDPAYIKGRLELIERFFYVPAYVPFLYVYYPYCSYASDITDLSIRSTPYYMHNSTSNYNTPSSSSSPSNPTPISNNKHNGLSISSSPSLSSLYHNKSRNSTPISIPTPLSISIRGTESLYMTLENTVVRSSSKSLPQLNLPVVEENKQIYRILYNNRVILILFLSSFSNLDKETQEENQCLIATLQKLKDIDHLSKYPIV